MSAVKSRETFLLIRPTNPRLFPHYMTQCIVLCAYILRIHRKTKLPLRKMKNKMAASYGSGLQSPPPIGRPVDRVFEEAQFTGEIYLNGRKLRDYPKLCSKYDLSDTIHVGKFTCSRQTRHSSIFRSLVSVKSENWFILLQIKLWFSLYYKAELFNWYNNERLALNCI